MITPHYNIECPCCGMGARLYCSIGGLLGYFCHHCKCVGITKDPNIGWYVRYIIALCDGSITTAKQNVITYAAESIFSDLIETEKYDCNIASLCPGIDLSNEEIITHAS